MTTPKRISFSIAVAVIVLCTFTVTAFASSLGLDDAQITFQICGYYTQYAQNVTYTQGSQIWPDGTISSAGSNNYKLSSSFSVIPGGTLFVYRSDSSNHLHRLYGVCFYDSQGNVVPGGIDGSIEKYFLAVPAGAVSARVTIYRTGTAASAGTNSKPIAAPNSGVDASNYEYLWSEIDDITLDANGDIVLPYQTNAYKWFMLDFKFFDTTYQFSNIAFNFYATKTGGYFSGERLLDYSLLSITTYNTDDSGNTNYHLLDAVNVTSGENPYRYSSAISHEYFSGFRIYCEIDGGDVSTSIKVRIYDFELDGEDVAVHLDTKDALNELDELGEQLELPTPDTSIIYQNLNIVVNNLDDDNFQLFDWFGPSGGIVVTMCMTTFTFAALGYILFGKKG